MYVTVNVKYPLFLSDFSYTWSFSTDFTEVTRCKISWKSVERESSSMWADGRTWRS